MECLPSKLYIFVHKAHFKVADKEVFAIYNDFINRILSFEKCTFLNFLTIYSFNCFKFHVIHDHQCNFLFLFYLYSNLLLIHLSIIHFYIQLYVDLRSMHFQIVGIKSTKKKIVKTFCHHFCFSI